MKKLGLFLAMLLLTTITTFAGTIKININGNEIKSTIAPIQKNGTTLVPIRIISEELGALVDWDSKTQTITIGRGDTLLVLTLGNKEMLIIDCITEQETKMALAVAPIQINGTTMVPLRAISEGLDCKIDYKNGVINISALVILTHSVTDSEAALQDYLNTQYGTCTTTMGDIHMYFSAFENTQHVEDWPCDLEIAVRFFDKDAELLKTLISSDSESGTKVFAQLKSHMEKISLDLLKTHPSTKLWGYYDLSYYQDPADSNSLVPIFFNNWTNYTIDENTTYSSSTLTSFNWIKVLDTVQY